MHGSLPCIDPYVAGIYAGPHGSNFLADFELIINEILALRVRDGSQEHRLGDWFERVVLTLLADPDDQ
jgi:hypothetical protein